MNIIPWLLVGWVISQCTPVRRREWRTLDSGAKTAFIEAFKQLAEGGENSRLHQLANIHINNAPNIHYNAFFLVWHRHFVHEVHQALIEINPSVEMPYWDWTLDYRNPASSPVFQDLGGNGGADGCILDGPFANFMITATADGAGPRCLTRRFDRGNRLSAFASQNAVDPLINQADYLQFAPELEALPHALPHNNIGGEMSSMASPNDPIFVLHHGMIDKIFSRWQLARDSSAYNFEATTRTGQLVNIDTDLPVFNIPFRQALDTRKSPYCYEYDDLQSLTDSQLPAANGNNPSQNPNNPEADANNPVADANNQPADADNPVADDNNLAANTNNPASDLNDPSQNVFNQDTNTLDEINPSTGTNTNNPVANIPIVDSTNGPISDFTQLNNPFANTITNQFDPSQNILQSSEDTPVQFVVFRRDESDSSPEPDPASAPESTSNPEPASNPKPEPASNPESDPASRPASHPESTSNPEQHSSVYENNYYPLQPSENHTQINISPGLDLKLALPDLINSRQLAQVLPYICPAPLCTAEEDRIPLPSPIKNDWLTLMGYPQSVFRNYEIKHAQLLRQLNLKKWQQSRRCRKKPPSLKY